MPDEKPTNINAPAKKSRRKKWLIGLGGIVVLVVLFVALLPSLLCTGPGVRLIVSQINSRIAGKVKIGNLSVGWLSPLSVSHVTLLDPEGTVVVKDAAVKTHLSLLALLTNWHQLGTIDIPVASLRLATVNGKLNLLQAVASRISKAASAAAPAKPASATPTSPSVKPSATASVIPVFAGRIKLSIQKLTWLTVGEPPLKASGVQFAATFNTRSSKPSHIAFSAATGLGNATPAKISLLIQAVAFDRNGLLPLQKITGSAEVQTQHLELACLNPLLASSGLHIKAQGMLSLDAAAHIQSHAAINSKIALRATGVRLRGAMLKGDKPDIGTVNVRINTLFDVSGPTPMYQIENCTFSSSQLGTISVSGKGAWQALLAILRHGKQKASGTAKLAIKVQSVLSDAIKQFPHMLKVPQGATFSGGTLSLTADVATARGAHATQTVTASMAHSVALPPVAIKLQGDLSPIIWKMPSHQHAQKAYGSLRLSGDTTGGPISIALHAFAGGGGVKASTLSLNGQLSPFVDRHLKTLSAITGNLALKMSHIYLSYLKRFNLPVQLGGVMHGRLAMVSNKARQGRISGRMQIDTLSLGGKLLHGDHPVLGNLQIPVDMVWDADRLNIEQIALQCPAFNISAAGAVNLSRLGDLRSTNGNWGHTSLSVRSTVNTALFTDAFRHTLHLNHLPFQVKTGQAVLQAQLASRGTVSTGKLLLTISAQKCRWKGTPSEIDPLTVNALAIRQVGHWSVDKIDTFQTGRTSAASIWRVGLQSSHKAAHLSYSLVSNFNLGLLQQELSPFIEMDGKSVNGDFSAKGRLSNIRTARPHVVLTLAFQHLMYQSDGKSAPVHIASVTLPISAKLQMIKGKLKSIIGQLAVQSPQLMDMTAAAAITPSPIDIQHLNLNLVSVHLQPLWRLIQAISPSVPMYQLAGDIKNSPIDISYQPGRLKVSQLALHLRQLSLSGGTKGTAPFAEPDLNVSLAATVHTGKTHRITVSQLAVKSGDGLVLVDVSKPVIWTSTPQRQELAAPSIRAAADLGKLQNLLINMGKLPAGSKLAGQLTLKAAALRRGQILTMMLNSQVHGYQMVLPSTKQTLSPTNLLVKLVGQADMQKKLFTATHTCEIGASSGKSSSGTTLTIARESVLAWGPGGIENLHGSLQYNLARLVALLKPFLPPNLTATGSGTMPLVVTGPLTSKPGLLAARQLTIASTALKFTNLTYDGTVLGPGSVGFSESAGHINIIPTAVPANQGTLNLGGYIDLTGNVPVYVLSSPLQLAKNVQINAPMGASILKFLPLTWGNKGNPALLNVQGLLNMSLKNAYIPLASSAMKKNGTALGTVSITHLTTNAPFVGQVSALAGPLGGNISIADSGIRPTQFALKNGRVSYKNMKLVLSSFGLDMGGWVSLDNQMNVDLNITGGGLTLPIPLKLAGSTSSPQIKLTSHPLKSIGKGIKGQVKGLLHGLFGH